MPQSCRKFVLVKVYYCIIQNVTVPPYLIGQKCHKITILGHTCKKWEFCEKYKPPFILHLHPDIKDSLLLVLFIDGYNGSILWDQCVQNLNCCIFIEKFDKRKCVTDVTFSSWYWGQTSFLNYQMGFIIEIIKS